MFEMKVCHLSKLFLPRSMPWRCPALACYVHWCFAVAVLSLLGTLFQVWGTVRSWWRIPHASACHVPFEDPRLCLKLQETFFFFGKSAIFCFIPKWQRCLHLAYSNWVKITTSVQHTSLEYQLCVKTYAKHHGYKVNYDIPVYSMVKTCG